MATVTFTDHDATITTTNAFSFTATIGTQTSTTENIYIGIGANGNNAPVFSSVTLDGVAASQLVQDTQTVVTQMIIAWYVLPRASLPTPTNTSVTLNITFTNTLLRCVADTYVSPDAVAVATDTTTAKLGVGGTLTLDSNTSANGIAIGFALGLGAATCVWSGLTEQSDADASSSAKADNTAAETPRAITASVSGGANQAQMAAVVTFAEAPPAGKLVRGFFMGAGLGGSA
jgi:opacity protein-like surface antigen